jgi:hypothetical protein
MEADANLDQTDHTEAAAATPAAVLNRALLLASGY